MRRFQTTTSQNGSCRENESRGCYRVKVRRDLVLELAVWFCNRKDIRRIHLRELGAPSFILGKPPYPLIYDISAGGMALTIMAEAARPRDVFRHDLPLALVYFKLQDACAGHPSPLSFMAGYEVKRVQYLNDRIYLGMSLALDGVPHPDELALDFVDARKYGIACLTKWCENMHGRADRGICKEAFSGLRLDMLLDQLDVAMSELPGRAVCQEL